MPNSLYTNNVASDSASNRPRTIADDIRQDARTPTTRSGGGGSTAKQGDSPQKNSGIDWVDALTYAANANQNAGNATPTQQVMQPNIAPAVSNPSSPVSNSNGSSGTVKPGTRTPGGSGVATVPPAGSSGSSSGSGEGGSDGGAGGLGSGGGSGSSGGGSGSSGGGSGSSDDGGSSGGGGYNGTGYSAAELLSQALKSAGLTAEPYKLPEIDGPNPERLNHVDTTELQNLLQQIVDTQKQQGNAQIDYGVQQGINELTRAMEDAATQYQTQRDQATADELRALDNQALYAEARGDRGGIGESQYASIQAAAAQNRRAVNDAQTKLGTDTARQIADLRSQGEFQKADQLLSITQSYLKDLMGLEQWALEANLGVDEFNSRLQQWVDEYNLNVQQFLTDLDLSAAQLTGVFANGKQTMAAKQRLNESLASSGSALLSAGVLPSRQQLEAMGMTEKQAKAYISKISG